MGWWPSSWCLRPTPSRWTTSGGRPPAGSPAGCRTAARPWRNGWVTDAGAMGSPPCSPPTWPVRSRPPLSPSTAPGSRCCMTGGCASVTTGSAMGCPRPSCTPVGGSTWTGPIRAGRAGGRPWRASAASSVTCRCAGTGSASSSSATSPPGGAWTTSSTVPRWRISWNRTSAGRKAGSTGSANVVDMHPESARLTFREMTPDDLDDLALLLSDPEVMTYYPRPKTRAEAAQWIDWNVGLYRTHGYGLWLLTTADGGTELEVGYHVRPALQGRGYATEAAAASRDFASDVLGASRLIAIIHPANRPSQR